MSDHEGYNKIEGLPDYRGAFAIMANKQEPEGLPQQLVKREAEIINSAN